MLVREPDYNQSNGRPRFSAPIDKLENKSSVICVLLIEDNPGDAILIGEMLRRVERQDFRLITADSLHAGVSAALEEMPDIVLLDLHLPDATGLDSLTRLHDGVGKTLPVIILSGMSSEKFAPGAFLHDAQDYLQKTGLSAEILVRSMRYSIERHRVALALRENEGRFRAITENLSDLIFIVDHQNCLRYASPSTRRYLTGNFDDHMGCLFADVLQTEDLAKLFSEFDHAWQQPGVVRNLPDFSIRTAQSEYWLAGRTIALPDEHGVNGLVISCHDITERKNVERVVERQATHDLLTDLPNRSLFNDRMSLAIEVTHRSESKCAVLFVDIDGFKEVNDTHGHDVGDKLLREISVRLKACVRRTDTVARMGGDEFAIVLDSIENPSIPRSVADKLLAALSTEYAINDLKVHVSASIGLAIYPEDGLSADEMLRHADSAMYEAKRSGKNRYHFYTAEMQELQERRRRIENELRIALKESQFFVAYQPIVDATSGRTASLEALIRWQHPERGVQSPVVFIPIAEESDLIDEIGAWLMREVVSQIAAWRHEGLGDLRVSINVSPRQFRGGETIALLKGLLAEYDVASDCVTLEITESMYLDVGDGRVEEEFAANKELGARIAIDDFGTGYSSFGYLRKFPVDILKIDREFIQLLSMHAEDLALVSAIISMAHALDIKVVAEGVETEEQRDILRNLDCDFIQGFFYARPENASLTKTYLTAH